MWRVRGCVPVCCLWLVLAGAAPLPAQIFPTVDLVAPTNGSVFPFSETIRISSSPNDADGYIYVVEFYSGTNKVGEVMQPPFDFMWTNAPQGFHRLSAQAVDDSGRRAFSQYVYVQVGSQSPPRYAVRGPYLQMGTPTSIVIRWRTEWLMDTKIWYGTKLYQPEETNFDATVTAEHELRLTNLAPNTRYYYAFGSSAGITAIGPLFTFVTAPLGPKPTRIWAIGDSGTGNENAEAVKTLYEAESSEKNTDVWLMLGDNAYEGGTDDEYQKAVFEMYPEMLRKTIVWPALGNHDTSYAGKPGEFPFTDIFTLPRNGEAGGVASGTEKYYSFDHANIHFVCLDSQSTYPYAGGPMVSWLEQDLAATSQDWIIAYWHHPPYTKGTYDSDADLRMIQLRQDVLPILERYGVDLVLSGHSHVYERSYLLSGHYGFSTNLDKSMILNSSFGREEDDGAYRKPAGGLGAGQGTVYVVCGCSGEGGLTEVSHHPVMRASSGGFGSLALDIDGYRLDAKFLRVPDGVYDYFTLIKGVPAPEIQPRLEIRQQDETVRVSWPTSLVPFRLESAAAVAPTAGWSVVSDLVWQFGRKNFVDVPLAETNAFFRLRADLLPHGKMTP